MLFVLWLYFWIVDTSCCTLIWDGQIHTFCDISWIQWGYQLLLENSHNKNNYITLQKAVYESKLQIFQNLISSPNHLVTQIQNVAHVKWEHIIWTTAYICSLLRQCLVRVIFTVCFLFIHLYCTFSCFSAWKISWKFSILYTRSWSQ